MMLRFLARDESGMTMGLVIIMIVLIGVMGAGLLTFVQRDLETVVEVNQDQKALELADVGVQEARRQLVTDSVRQHYDREGANDCESPRKRKGNDWSPNTESRDCSGGGAGTPVDKTGTPGVTRNFGDGQFQVTIECFAQAGDPRAPSSTVPCSKATTGSSPEPDTMASQRSFFKVISIGLYPDESGAKRWVEAIVYRESRGLPPAYYTPKDIDFNGRPLVNGVSFFASGNITGVGGGDMSIGPDPDPLLGNWSTNNPSSSYVPVSNFNTLPRSTAATGFGALGRVCRGTNTTSCARSAAESFYDSTSSTSRPSLFLKADPNAVNVSDSIAFPFNSAAEPDMELLQEEAESSGSYYVEDKAFSIKDDEIRKALSRSFSLVIFVDYQGASSGGNNVTYDADHDDASTLVVIVVRNGNFVFAGNNEGPNGDRGGDAEFRGVVIVEGDGESTGTYNARGNSELSGFVFADGKTNVSGNARAQPLLAEDDEGNVPPPDLFDRLPS